MNTKVTEMEIEHGEWEFDGDRFRVVDGEVEVAGRGLGEGRWIASWSEDYPEVAAAKGAAAEILRLAERVRELEGQLATVTVDHRRMADLEEENARVKQDIQLMIHGRPEGDPVKKEMAAKWTDHVDPCASTGG